MAFTQVMPPTAATSFPYVFSGGATINITYSFSASGQPKALGTTWSTSGTSYPPSNWILEVLCSGSNSWSGIGGYTSGSVATTQPNTAPATCTNGGVAEYLRLRSPSGFTWAATTYPAGAVINGPVKIADFDAPSCTSAFSASTAVAYSGGTLSAVVGWKGTAPVGGWKVYAPGSEWAPSGQTPQLTIGTTATTTPGEYTSTATVSASLMTGVGFARIEKASDPTCYVRVPVGSSTVMPGPSNNGTTDTGEDCGINVFCSMRAALSWVFVPDDASKANIGDTFDGISGKFPFGTVATFSDWFSLVSGCASSATDFALSTTCAPVDLSFSIPGVSLTGTTAHSFVIADEASPAGESLFMSTLHNLRGTLTTLIWAVFLGGLAWAVYRWASPFGVLAVWSGGKADKKDD